MMGQRTQKDAVLVELMSHSDVFATGLARIEKLPGDNFRFIFYAQREENGETVREIVARLVMPLVSLPRAMRQTAEAIGETPIMVEEGRAYSLM